MKMEYKALNRENEEIRLIGFVEQTSKRIDSGDQHGYSQALNDIIRCHLWHFSLGELRRDCETLNKEWNGLDAEEARTATWNPTQGYVALSYTWGDPSRTRGIEVNGVKVKVTTNLEAALRALSSKKLMRQGYALEETPA